jgi:hypothetical protein
MRLPALAACVVLLAVSLFPSVVSIAAEQDRLLVYGKGFLFGVKEPQGWMGDTEHANEAGANILFYRKGERYEKAVALIRVRLADKVDENTAGDLEYDINDYRKKFDKLELADLPLKHPSYSVFSRTMFVPKKFYDYVAYLNPGTGNPRLFAVSMFKNKKEATADELAALQTVLESVVLLPTKEK